MWNWKTCLNWYFKFSSVWEKHVRVRCPFWNCRTLPFNSKIGPGSDFIDYYNFNSLITAVVADMDMIRYFLDFFGHLTGSNVKFNLNGKILFPTSSVKYLGVFLDEHLYWKKQLAHVIAKLNQGIGILSKLRHSANLNILKIVYHSLVG